MTPQELWARFTAAHSVEQPDYEAWAFGGDPDGLARLVLRGEKTGTSSAYDLYALEGEPLPQPGKYDVLLNARDEAVCILRTTKVYVTPFHAVTADHARKEGEGDKSLAYWRQVHEAFFTDCLREAGLRFSPETQVVCEEFEVVFRAPEAAPSIP